jgi:C-8 sterol isomerase
VGYVFDAGHLQEVTNRHLNLPLQTAFDEITQELAAAYPGHVRTQPRRWLLSNAGGAMGQICLIHASVSEYLLFFGTPIGTEGHSGRYPTRVWDFMIQGEVWTYVEGSCERIVSKPGVDAMDLKAGVAKGYRAFEDSWMLEYARGPIPLMLPFGLWDTLFGTLDIVTLGKTLWQYGELAAGQILRGKI